MNHKEKIFVAIAVVLFIAFFIWNKRGAGVSLPASVSSGLSLGSFGNGTVAPITIPTLSTASANASNNVPWWLTYNNSLNFANGIGNLLPLPNQSAGQNNGGGNGTCEICSLFPNYSTVQL